jgi:uncharacterized protein (DUF488 family)
MIFDRQKRLLALVGALGGDVGNLDFQKLLFLYCSDVEVTPAYEFVPYKYGGFSFTSYADKRRLIQQGYLADEERTWRLTSMGRAVADVDTPTWNKMELFVRRYAQLRGDTLVAEAYRRHPFYAINSEIAQRVLADDAIALQAIQRATPSPPSPGICTIGYEGRTFEGYLNKLLHAGVSLICDVRRNPLSRKYGFSKSTLKNACESLNITYFHLPELGIASEDRRELVTQADYNELFAIYRRDTLPLQSDSLQKIHQWVETGKLVALTCYEADPARCHRQCVATELEKRYGLAFQPQQL